MYNPLLQLQRSTVYGCSYSRMTEQNEEVHAVTGHAHLLACELARHGREGRVDRRERVVRLRARVHRK